MKRRNNIGDKGAKDISTGLISIAQLTYLELNLE